MLLFGLKTFRMEVRHFHPLIERSLSCLTFFSCMLRRQQEAELKLVEEETAKRVEEAMCRKVEESLNSEDIRVEIQRLLEEGRKKLLVEVAVLLEKEKEAAVIEARQKEVNTLVQHFSSVLLLPFCIRLSATLR